MGIDRGGKASEWLRGQGGGPKCFGSPGREQLSVQGRGYQRRGVGAPVRSAASERQACLRVCEEGGPGVSDVRETTSGHLRQSIPLGNLRFLFLFVFVLLSVPPFFYFIKSRNVKVS